MGLQKQRSYVTAGVALYCPSMLKDRQTNRIERSLSNVTRKVDLKL